MSDLALNLGVHLILPAALLLWLARSRAGSRLSWMLQTLAPLLGLLLLMLTGLWILLPWYSGVLWLVIGLVLAWRRARQQLGSLPWLVRPVSIRSLCLSLLIPGLLCLIIMYQLRLSLSAWDPGNDLYVDIDFPLVEGTYYIAQGGSRPILNAHIKILERSGDRAASYQGQGYALDIVALNSWGMPLRNWQYFKPESHQIFGAWALAPCSGEVVQMRDDLPDLRVSERDTNHLEGNHVLLDCGGFHLLLAHLRQSSVVVRAGDMVRSGDTLGQVGNSGNTGQPHLHIHAQTPGTAERPFSGEPLKMRIEGTYLVRNMTVSG